MSKSKEPTVKIFVSHVDKLVSLRSSACWMLFTILLFEDIASRGKPFILPSGVAGSSKGLSEKTAPGTPSTGSRRSDLDTRAGSTATADHHPMSPPDAQSGPDQCRSNVMAPR
jgi:hypothetical protein